MKRFPCPYRIFHVRTLTNVASSPFQPELQVQVFGFVQMPLTHDGEQIAIDDQNDSLACMEYFIEDYLRASQIVPFQPELHVQVFGLLHVPLMHAGEQIANEY